jgi:hypothetical protein
MMVNSEWFSIMEYSAVHGDSDGDGDGYGDVKEWM